MTRPIRRGFALIESVISLAILGLAGMAASSIVVQSYDSVRRAQAREAAVRAASSFMEAVALWSAADLDRRLGERDQGPWRLRIQRSGAGLYDVRLSDSSTVLITTRLFRPSVSAP